MEYTYIGEYLLNETIKRRQLEVGSYEFHPGMHFWRIYFYFYYTNVYLEIDKENSCISKVKAFNYGYSDKIANQIEKTITTLIKKRIPSEKEDLQKEKERNEKRRFGIILPTEKIIIDILNENKNEIESDSISIIGDKKYYEVSFSHEIGRVKLKFYRDKDISCCGKKVLDFQENTKGIVSRGKLPDKLLEVDLMIGAYKENVLGLTNVI